MRKVLLHMYVTLDGFAAFPKFAGSDDEQLEREIEGEMWTCRWDSIDTILLGRGAYESWARYWPRAKDDASSTGFQVEFSRFANRVEKVVFSNTLQSVGWENARLVHSDVVEEITRLKQLPGKNLSLGGGARIARTCMDLGLIDEYLLTVFPVILGTGDSIFGPMRRQRNLKLVRARTFTSGPVFLHYQAMQDTVPNGD